ncbi:MAG: LTA synthase family protein [Lachnospiraceae bacterium]|nr:LTA synthase family protein [Lachnospiraceae bacterium]
MKNTFDKIKKLMNYQLPDRVTNAFVMSCVLIVVNFLLVFNGEAIATCSSDSIWLFYNWTLSGYFWYAFFTLTALGLILYSITGKWFVSCIVMQLGTFIGGIANRVTYTIRSTFISVSDFKLLKEAAGVKIDLISLYDKIWLILGVFNIILAAVVWWLDYKKIGKSSKGDKKIRGFRLIMASVGALIILCMYVWFPTNAMIYKVNSQLEIGTTLWFYNGFFRDTSHNVTKEDVDAIYESFEPEEIENAKPVQNRPNVIVVMSEAFWNVNHLGNRLEMENNPMDAYYEVAEECVSGQVAVNVFGGGTNTTEFEFLTGLNAMNFSGVSDWYGVLCKYEQDSFVQYMKSLGYTTLAFHPYEADFWEREEGYASIGFDEFYSREDFLNTEKYHGYISDNSVTNEIINRYEEQKTLNPEEPIFCFAVTIQNHVSDLDGNNPDESQQDAGVTIQDATAKEHEIRDVNEYINGMHKSVEALNELIAYYENCDEDTMIVFFGDHAPSFVTSIWGPGGNNIDSLHRTPYLIWTNYENDYEAYGDFNISYLSTVLLEYLDFPKTRQYYMNKKLMSKYPVNTQFEVNQAQGEELMDVLRVAWYVYQEFSRKENALDFWHVVDADEQM